MEAKEKLQKHLKALAVWFFLVVMILAVLGGYLWESFIGGFFLLIAFLYGGWHFTEGLIAFNEMLEDRIK